ncbi:MAG TPA: efflux RND transporter periplasmic adaptor subunit [Verrucomicrobiae bacterium]
MKNLLIIALLIGGGVWGYMKWKETAAAQQAKDPIANRTKTAPVESRDISFAINVAGEIGPAEQVSVRPEINGRILQLPVDIGDRVKKGALLFALDDKDLLIEIATRETDIEAAKLQLDKAKRDFEREEKLYKEKLVSQELYDNARTEFELAKNSIEKAERSLELSKDRYSKSKIMAPFDCTVLTRPVSVGQAVSGSAGFNSGTEVMSIANLNEMIIIAHVNQADITRIKPAMEVDVKVEAVSGLKVKGKVNRIAPQATIKNNIKGFEVRVLITEIEDRIQPGMTANLAIPVASAAGVLAVPLPAVFSEQGERYAYVVKDNVFEQRPVRVGISDFFYAEILSGLQVGELVALEQPPTGAEVKSAGIGKGDEKKKKDAPVADKAPKSGT